MCSNIHPMVAYTPETNQALPVSPVARRPYASGPLCQPTKKGILRASRDQLAQSPKPLQSMAVATGQSRLDGDYRRSAAILSDNGILRLTIEMRLQSLDRREKSIIVFVRVLLDKMCMLACFRVFTMVHLAFVAINLGFMGHDARLILKDRGFGALENGQRMEMIVAPTIVVLVVGQVLSVFGLIGCGHDGPFEDWKVAMFK